MTDTSSEDLHAPVLPGRGASDYERYLRTDELLSLQKPAEERVHHDELLFQTVHQSSELWLELGTTEVDEAAGLLERGEVAPAIRLMRRAVLCRQYVATHLEMLNQMSPWEYHQLRIVLGHGSGFDSPGFRRVPVVTQRVSKAFDRSLERARALARGAVSARPRARGAVHPGGAAHRVGRADLGLAVSPLHDRGSCARRGDDRDAGDAGAGARQADRPEPDPQLWDVRSRLVELFDAEQGGSAA